jgi:hypothetical protein
VRVAADAIDRDDIALILDRAGDEQGAPVMLARAGPACADGEEFRAVDDAQPPEFREAQVVTDLRADLHAVDVGDDEFIAAGVVFDFLAVAEGVDFAVGGDDIAVGRDDGCAVASAAVGAALRVAVLKPDAAFEGEVAGPVERNVIDDGLSRLKLKPVSPSSGSSTNVPGSMAASSTNRSMVA